MTKKLQSITEKVFIALEEAWKKQNVSLVDLKIECGHDSNYQIVVADVVENDSWRVWPSGDKEQMKDKQVYRDNQMNAELRKKLKKNYEWVANSTDFFLQ